MRRAHFYCIALAGFLFVAGCAPLLHVDQDSSQISGHWLNPKSDSLSAYEKVERLKTTREELKALGFDPEAQVIEAPNEKEKKKKDSSFKKPSKLDGADAFRLYLQMLFPEGSYAQTLTEEAIEKRQAEVGRYEAYIFIIEDIKERKDRLWFSNNKISKTGYRYEFKFILKDGIVIEKSKKEEEFNDSKTERAFGKGALEIFKGIREIIPFSIFP